MASILNAAIGTGITYIAPIVISATATNFIASAGAIAIISGACATYSQISNDGIIRWCVNRAKNQTTVTVPRSGLVVILDGREVPRDQYIIFDSANAPDDRLRAENGWVLL